MAGRDEILSQGVAKAISDDNFARLEQRRSLNIKLGIDPSTADLHLGHAVVLRKLKQFQDAGHHIILVIGDFTALIGDPSGRNKTRPVITEKEVKANLRTYLDQAGQVINVNKTKIVFNSSWLKKLNFISLMKYAQQLSVNQLIERDDFAKRLQNNDSLTLNELLYPLAQAIDSIELEADIEIGGYDQLLNLLTARELQKKMGQKPQDIITLDLLVGSDGVQKMSKSYGNFIGLTDTAEEMFGKLMRVADKLIPDYARLGAWLNEDEVKKITTLPPRQAKELMAQKIVALYRGEDEAKNASMSFNKTFKDKEIDESLVKILRFKSESFSLIEAVKEATGKSGSEATRLIEQQAVKVNGQTVSDKKQVLDLAKPIRLQIGKHRFYELRLK